MKALAAAGMLLTAGQIGYILLSGSALCPNEGCRIVEQSTVISPLQFNLLGLAYFTLLMVALVREEHRPASRIDYTGILLLAGLAAEGVLVAYQIYVAQALCFYCLAVFTVVLLLNLVAGHRQRVTGLALFAAVLIAFSLLTFVPSSAFSENYSLDLGTLGTINCSEPSEKVYLIFSSDCPHCHEVVEALEGCDSCDLHFNPVDRQTTLDIKTLTEHRDYVPEVNRLALSLFGIGEVPVLVAKNPQGYRLIKGAGPIIEYINQACVKNLADLPAEKTIPSLEPQRFLPGYATDDAGMSTIGVPTGIVDDTCTVGSDCEPTAIQ